MTNKKNKKISGVDEDINYILDVMAQAKEEEKKEENMKEENMKEEQEQAYREYLEKYLENMDLDATAEKTDIENEIYTPGAIKNMLTLPADEYFENVKKTYGINEATVPLCNFTSYVRRTAVNWAGCDSTREKILAWDNDGMLEYITCMTIFGFLEDVYGNKTAEIYVKENGKKEYWRSWRDWLAKRLEEHGVAYLLALGNKVAEGARAKKYEENIKDNIKDIKEDIEENARKTCEKLDDIIENIKENIENIEENKENKEEINYGEINQLADDLASAAVESMRAAAKERAEKRDLERRAKILDESIRAAAAKQARELREYELELGEERLDDEEEEEELIEKYTAKIYNEIRRAQGGRKNNTCCRKDPPAKIVNVMPSTIVLDEDKPITLHAVPAPAPAPKNITPAKKRGIAAALGAAASWLCFN